MDKKVYAQAIVVRNFFGSDVTTKDVFDELMSNPDVTDVKVGDAMSLIDLYDETTDTNTRAYVSDSNVKIVIKCPLLGEPKSFGPVWDLISNTKDWCVVKSNTPIELIPCFHC